MIVYRAVPYTLPVHVVHVDGKSRLNRDASNRCSCESHSRRCASNRRLPDNGQDRDPEDDDEAEDEEEEDDKEEGMLACDLIYSSETSRLNDREKGL